MARTVNAEARAAARVLAASGMGTAEIARRLAASGITVSQRQVRRWCEGLLPDKPGPRLADAGSVIEVRDPGLVPQREKAPAIGGGRERRGT